MKEFILTETPNGPELILTGGIELWSPLGTFEYESDAAAQAQELYGYADWSVQYDDEMSLFYIVPPLVA